MRLRARTGSVAAVLTALALLHAGPATAATFRVSPVQLSLTSSSTSGLLTLSNESTETLRFQLTAYRWAEDERGQMQLLPTEDLAVFPTLLTLEPGKERKIRIGTAAAAAPSEKTYRVFVEELPGAADSAEAGTRIKVLTRMGIPIFFKPLRTETGAEISEAKLENSRLRFLVRNSGNVHFTLQTVRALATSESGETVLDRQENGWYVLAGGAREYQWTLTPQECARVRTLRIEAKTETGVIETRVEAPPGACRERAG